MKHSNESLNKAICSSISGTTIYQNQLHEGNSQKWTFTDVGDGYYTIRTNYSSALYYLGVISDSTALDVDVGLRSGALTDGMKWKIGITEVGAYKLIPKTGEANGYVLAAKVSDGAKLIQGAYVDNNTYRDEWMICKISYRSHIIHYYDEGFEVLFGNFNQDPEKIIRKYHNEVNKMLMGAFGLHLSFEICSYTSEADDCKKEQYENITFERLVGDCPHSFSESHSLTTLGMRNGTSNGNITTSVVVWTGHILPGNPPSESKEGPKYGVVMTPQHLINAEGNYQDMTLLEIEKKYVEILLHELSHQVGAEDHGCYGQINKNPCSNTFCDICYGESGVLRSCVMGNRTNFWGETDDSRYCSECKNIIRSHLENHHNIWDTW